MPKQRRKLKVMTDYGAFPVWDCEPWESIGLGQAMVDPDELPLSPELRQRLDWWAEDYERWIFGKEGVPELAPFVEDGREIAQQLQRELGDGYEITYFNERTGAVEAL